MKNKARGVSKKALKLNRDSDPNLVYVSESKKGPWSK